MNFQQSRNRASLLERHKAVMPGWLGLYYHDPIEIVGGEGRRVLDSDGRTYLDFFGGILTTMTGYNTPEVVRAVRDQAGKMMHTSTLYLVEPQIELAEEIAALSGIPDPKVFFTSSGTEANDTALMLATAYRRSNQILAMRHSYHGRSFSAIAATGNSSWSPSSLSPFSVSYIHGSYPYRSPYAGRSDSEYINACVADLENTLEVATSGNVACLIAEPILGVSGFAMPPNGLFGSFKKVLDKHGILFISDEVQTGWGRTGDHFWGYEAHDVVPDMLTFAKGLGNGLAIGGVVARGEIMDCLTANSISTFGGNPLATRGALANLHVLKQENLQENAANMGSRLRMGFMELARRCPSIGDVRGKGLMIGLEFVQPGTSEPNRDAVDIVMESAKRQGLLVGRGGFYGNVIRMAPPLSVTEEEVTEALTILASAVSEIV